ncbi:hypothetical protein NQ318_004244 [Aromia moschata]|uniref:Uncharacterized protein n=1 Tax=Aromia moschata TaxID=1265417 RepID=A0AAV8XH81_9CUCU|nr:hypothetical protein NQ318_004244 [Aromia moschata]
MYEVCKLSNETGNVAPDLATLRIRDLEGRVIRSQTSDHCLSDVEKLTLWSNYSWEIEIVTTVVKLFLGHVCSGTQRLKRTSEEALPLSTLGMKEAGLQHMAHLKYGRTEKSCVAQHAFDNNHRIDMNNLKLIRNVTNSGQLDAFESLEIITCNNSMNKDNGPIPTSPLFALINKDSYGSVNRGNKFSINSASV